MSKVCVVVLNPCIDLEWLVQEVQWEEKTSIEAARRWGGGKGVNVSRWLGYLGEHPELVLPLGGTTGEELAACLRRERLSFHPTPLREPTRVNTLVTTRSGRQLRFNETGPAVRTKEWKSIVTETGRCLKHAALLILSGALPRGLPADAYAQLIRLAHRNGVRTLLDCDGPAFAAAARARPFLVKPNTRELGEWCGCKLRRTTELRQAAENLSRTTGGWVLVSRGPAGAVLVNSAERCSISARAPRVHAVNTLGAGDAMLAATARSILHSAKPADWLEQAVAVGSAATQCQAGRLPGFSFRRLWRTVTRHPCNRS